MKLQNGINLGGYLSQCDHTEEHYASFISEQDVALIASWGFDHVRVPVDYNLLETEDGTLLPSGYLILDRLVNWCAACGLEMIIDLHSTCGFSFDSAGTEGKNILFKDSNLQNRFVSLWERIAARYSGYGHLAFELLNEVVEREDAEAWNELIARTVKAIRTLAPNTTLIYGGTEWNSAKTLHMLRPPSDSNTIFTFHYYEPLVFTHQGAHWVPELAQSGLLEYPGSMEDYRKYSEVLGSRSRDVIESDADSMGIPFFEEFLKDALETAQRVGVRLYCGEYGVIDRAPITSTARWFSDVHSLFDRYGIGRAVWNYRAKDFGVFDAHYAGIRGEIFTHR